MGFAITLAKLEVIMVSEISQTEEGEHGLTHVFESKTVECNRGWGEKRLFKVSHTYMEIRNSDVLSHKRVTLDTDNVLLKLLW